MITNLFRHPEDACSHWEWDSDKKQWNATVVSPWGHTSWRLRKGGAWFLESRHHVPHHSGAYPSWEKAVEVAAYLSGQPLTRHWTLKP